MEQLRTDYLSDCLTCFHGEPTCAVCRFLAGAEDVPTLLEVIGRLDKALHDTARHERSLLHVLAGQQGVQGRC